MQDTFENSNARLKSILSQCLAEGGSQNTDKYVDKELKHLL